MSLVRRLLAQLLAWLAVLGAPAVRLYAQDQTFEGKRIVTIQFDPLTQPLDPIEINRILPLKPNQPLSADTVRQSIDRLFATGRYADIQVDAEPYQDGVVVRFLTKNSWFIGHVTVTGAISDPPSPGQLISASQLELGMPFTQEEVDTAVANQLRMLEANGLYHATVRTTVQWDNEYQRAQVDFTVASGRRATFTTPVLTGDSHPDPNRILAATGFRRWLIHTWKPVTEARVRDGLDGVRRFYEKQQRLEAVVALENLKYNPPVNTVTPTLHIDPGPRIQVNAIGAKVSQRKLAQYIPIFEEHTVDNDLLAEGAHNLQDYFQSEGYFDSDVEFKPQRVIQDHATIDYLINKGLRHKLVRIEIQGSRYFSPERIRERMFLRTASFLQFPHGRYSRDLLARDEDSISNLYQSNGFRDVKVTHRIDSSYGGREGQMAVTIVIQEGPQYFISSLDVEGIESLNRENLTGQLSAIAGQPFSEFNVAVDRDAILAAYFKQGFPKATFEWSSQAGPREHTIALRYVVREGAQEFVRQVLFNPGGMAHTRPSLVNRTITLNPGDPLSPSAMTEMQRKLYDLGIFSRVDTAIQDPDGETDQKYVLYDLEEARRYSVSWGVGAEVARIGGCNYCLDAPAGQTGFSPRFSFGMTRQNLWGLAQSVSLRARLSTLQKEALLTYSWPRFAHNDKLNVTFTGLYQDSRDVRTFDYKREEGSMQLSQRYSKSLTLVYRYSYRRVSESNLKITPELVPLLSQPVLLGLVSVNLIQDRRDDPVDPHRGVYTSLDLGLAEHVLGSQRDFVRFLARNATYYQLGKKFVLARNTEIGDIHPFHYSGDSIAAIPLPEKFYSGGSSSDRGFPENQSGPRDTETGFPIGGDALFFNQTELRFPLIGENVGGVLFHDFGNTFSELSNFSFGVKQKNEQDFDYMVHAVGFGIRYRTPVGPLRLDLAYSINPPKFFGFKGTEQELVDAGTNPCSGVPDLCTQQSVSHFQFFFSIGQTF